MWIALDGRRRRTDRDGGAPRPRGANGDDAPLPTDIETRILLGEDPDLPEPPRAHPRPASDPPDPRGAG